MPVRPTTLRKHRPLRWLVSALTFFVAVQACYFCSCGLTGPIGPQAIMESKTQSMEAALMKRREVAEIVHHHRMIGVVLVATGGVAKFYYNNPESEKPQVTQGKEPRSSMNDFGPLTPHELEVLAHAMTEVSAKMSYEYSVEFHDRSRNAITYVIGREGLVVRRY